jgi:hypothetical protein
MGDHDIKLGGNYEYVGAMNINQGNMNGTFGFARSDGPFDAGNAFTYPDLLTIRVGGEVALLREGALHHRLRAGQVADEQQADAQPGLPLRRGNHPDSRNRRPDSRARAITPVDKNNFQPRVGFSYDLAGRGVQVIRGGYGRFFEKTHFELIGGLFTATPFTNSFTRTFPLTGADPEPAPGADADRPDAGQRADAQPSAARHAVRSRNAAAQHRRELGQPGSPRAEDRSVHRSATSTSSGPRLSVSADYVHAQSSDMLMSLQLNPTLRATTAVTSPNIRQSSAILDQATAELRQEVRAQLRGVHRRRHHAAQRRRDRLRRADAAVRQAVQQQLQRARVLHARPLVWQHQRDPAWRRAGSRCSTTCTWS